MARLGHSADCSKVEEEEAFLDDPHPLELETRLLGNSANYAEVFERIFEKYDREFHEDEPGGEIIDLTNDIQIQRIFRTQRCKSPIESDSEATPGGSSSCDEQQYEPLPSPIQYYTVPVREEESGRVCKGRGSNEPASLVDSDLTVRLHKKVTEIKKEMNWDEEERVHQLQMKLKQPVDSSSEDEEPFVVPRRPVVPRVRAPLPLMDTDDGVSGFVTTTDLESGYEERQVKRQGRRCYKPPAKRRKICQPLPLVPFPPSSAPFIATPPPPAHHQLHTVVGYPAYSASPPPYHHYPWHAATTADGMMPPLLPLPPPPPCPRKFCPKLPRHRKSRLSLPISISRLS